MAKIALDLSQFKSAGVYTVEIDQSERIQVTTQSLRLVPGFSAVGPYNAPTFVRNTRDLQRFYGSIDTKLERKGSFFQRSIQTCLLETPVFAINLLGGLNTAPDSSLDEVNYVALSVDTSLANEPIRDSKYVNFFNRERFWKPDEDYLQGVVNNSVSATNSLDAPLFSIANVGTKDLSFIVRKANNLQGYNVTAVDWYGTATNIPYEWIRPYDYISDYFIQVIAFQGDWSDYAALATDPYYSEFFTSDGLIPSKINDFINADNVNLVGSWIGTIIPDFRDQTGAGQYIETIVNGSASITGVFLTVNRDALDQLIWDEDQEQWEIGDGTAAGAAEYLVDLTGHNLIGGPVEGTTPIDPSTRVQKTFLSYDIDVSTDVFQTKVAVTEYLDGESSHKKFYTDDEDDASSISVGTFIKSGAAIQPGVTRVTNKYFTTDVSTVDSPNGVYVFETAQAIAMDADSNYDFIKVQKTLEDSEVNLAYKMLQLNGLHIRNRHLPGFDSDGQRNAEEGVEKIYGMLQDPGILRGLTNPEMINYRYIVDTMAYGLQANMGGKSNLSSLAKKRGKCTAILNAPAIKQFASSQDPYFCDTFVSGVDPVPIFSTEYIPAGGNADMPRSFRFSLPDEALGSKYCGVFGPFLQYNENGKIINVPPAADVANAYIRKFLGGSPYAIVANRNGILSNPALSGVEYMIDKTDRDYLEPFGYNSIIERSATGEILIYANVTAFQNVKSDLNNLHVRELLNTLEIQIESVLQPFVFDFNNPVTRLNIINVVAPILETVKNAGALTKYELVMDETNNTADLIADGFGIVDIGLWVTGALTKIIARYTVNSEGSVSSGGFAAN